MTAELDLSVPGPAQRPSRRHGGRALPWLLLIAVLVNIALSWHVLRAIPDTAAARGPALAADAQKKLALKLEKQGLAGVAAGAWERYLAVVSPQAEEAARICYRIGTLHEDAGRYEQALRSYYRSESFARIDGIESEIARRTQECLEQLGKFAALRYELAERTAVDPSSASAGDEIVAEIGTRKISTAEIDRLIERQIEQAIAAMASTLPEDERNRRKESILKQVSAPAERARFVSQYVLDELLYRKARESNLAADPEVAALLRDQERSLLAARVMANELKDRIRIMPSDLETYYEANQEAFREDDGEAEGEGEGEGEGEKGRIPPFAEVREEVYRKLRAAKEEEARMRLLTQLRDRYDVVIHQGVLAPDAAGE